MIILMLDLFAQITTRFRHSSPCPKMEGHVWKAIHSRNSWMLVKIVSILSMCIIFFKLLTNYFFSVLKLFRKFSQFQKNHVDIS
jgi:hypothetical protein